MDTSMLDFMGICLDEIALEGLDGITMPGLWKRLEKNGKFPLPLDDASKQFIWECVLQHPDLELYLLEEPRLPLVIYNRYSNVDIEMGIVLDADDSAYEIYPHAPVRKDDVKGSCSTFETRKNISAELKTQSRNFFLAMHRNNEERIVVVASQEQRNRALLGTEVQPNLEFSLEQYCLLERIGRARYHGEVTMGKLSLAQMKIPNKKMFYIRKVLLKLNLITKQIHLQRIGNATQHSSLLHLRRFYVERLSKIQVMVMKMCEILKEKPNNRELFHTLRSELGMKEGSFKKMFNKAFQLCVQAKMIPYGEFYPDAPKEKRFSLNGKERQVKVAVLVKNYEEPEEEEFEDEEEDKCDIRFSMDPRKMTFDRPILTQLYNEVEKAGPNGITSNGLRMDLGISKLEIRLLLRNLERRNAVFTVMLDSGRQRASYYVAKCFEQVNIAQNQLLEMKQKLLSYSEEPANNFDFMHEDVAPKFSHNDVFNELNNVQVDYLEEDQTDILTKSWNFSLKDISSACKAGKDKETPNYTYKMLKRVNIVIEAVRAHKLIDDPFRIQKLIFQAEQEEGHTEKIDKKSTHRIISRLAKDGYIRSVKTRLTLGKKVKKLHFICHSSVKPDDPLVQSAIEQAKLKYFSVSKPEDQHESSTARGLSDSGFELRNMSNMKEGKMKVEFIPSIGKTYGLLPKFLRMKSLHLFLFYLVYDFEGSQVPFKIRDENSPAIYHLSETWKRFVPPLPQHIGKSKGWCLISDVILSMPLSLLLKVVNFTYRIEGIEVFTGDQIKQHYLLRHLPQDIRNMLLHSRKYIYTVHEVLTKLAFMGLVSFGPQQYKEKDQIFVYLHRKASVKDTSLSEPGHTTITPDVVYAVTKYNMKTYQDAENFWYDLETVCMRTPLGSSRNSTGVIKNIFNDPEMLEAARQKTCDEVKDDGETPGDGLGAGGLDSGMFAHLRRNWTWPAVSPGMLKTSLNRRDVQVAKEGCPVGVSYMKYLAQRDEEVSTVTDITKTKRLSRLSGKNKLVLPEQQVKLVTSDDSSKVRQEVKTSVVPNVVVRKGYKRKCPSSNEKPAKRAKKPVKKYKGRKPQDKPRKPYYDEKDQIALNKMSKQRVCWTVQEDSFLLLCKVTSCFLDPNHKGIVIPFSVIREMMHSRFPTLSFNKTSRACQRRILFMMRNPTTVANVSVFLLEAKQDTELVRQFQGPKPMKKDEAVWTQMFTTVLNHLLEKFTLSLKDRCIQLALPNSLDKFNKLYSVSVTGDIKDKFSAHNDPKNTVDIFCSVMFCFILASMCTIGDKNNWSYTLYRVYQQYPDSLLRSVVAKLKRDRLITKRKQVNQRTELTVPLSSLPHKLSVHFDMNLQTRYQPHIYERASQLFKLLTGDHSLPEPQGVELSGHIEPGDTALILSLNATGNVVFKIDVPDQVVIFDTHLSDDMKSKIEEKVKQYQKEDAQELPESERKSLLTDSSEETPFEVSASKASRIALYMLRHELGTSIADNLQHAQDYFLINTCGLKGVLHLPELTKWYPLSPFRAQSAMDTQRKFLPLEVTRPTTEVVNSIYLTRGYPDDITDDGVTLMMYILETKELGCLFGELYNFEMKGSLSVSDHLRILILNELVLRVGVTCFRYVSMFYCRPWVLNSIKVPKEERSVATEIGSQEGNAGKRIRRDTETKPQTASTVETGADSNKNGEQTIQKNSSRSEVIFSIELGNVSEYLEGFKNKICNWGPLTSNPDDSVISADQLFNFATLLLYLFSGEKVTDIILDHKDGVHPELLDMLLSSDTLCNTLTECFQRYTLNDLLKQMSKSEYVSNITNFLAALEDSETVLSVREAFSSIFCSISDTTLGFNADLLICVTDFINTILTRGLNVLLKTYKFSNVLQSLKSLTNTINYLKTASSLNSANNLKEWFEQSCLIPLEKDLSNAHHLPDKHTITSETAGPADLLKKGKGIDTAVQFCINDLIRKVQDIEISEKKDLREWFNFSVLKKIENEDIREWLQDFLLDKVDHMLQEQSLKKWLYRNVICHVEQAYSTEYNFIERWLNETILSKVKEQKDLLEIQEWIQEVLKKISTDERHSFEDKIELELWFSDVVLNQVEEINQAALDQQTLRSWFRENVLSAVESRTDSEPYNQSIFKVLHDIIDDIEWRDISLVVGEKLDKIINDTVSLEEAEKDLHKWFQEKVMMQIQDHPCISNEIIDWFDETFLKVLEKKTLVSNVDIGEVESWLEEELKKVISGLDSDSTTSELQCWFEENILNVLNNFDQDSSNETLTNIVKQCLDETLEKVVKDEDVANLTNDVVTCLDNQVLDVVETTSLLLSNISEIRESKGDETYTCVQMTEDDVNILPEKKESLKEKQVIRDCIDHSILDVIDVNSHLISEVENLNKTNPTKTLSVEQSKIRNQSVLDAVNEMSEFVHSVNALIEVIDDGQTIPTSEQIMSFESENLKSSAALSGNLFDAIDETLKLVDSATNLKESLDLSEEMIITEDHDIDESLSDEVCPMETEDTSMVEKDKSVLVEVGLCLQESVLDVVETASSVMDCLTKPDETSIKTDVGKCLQESVLDVVETTLSVMDCLTKGDESSTKTDETDVSKCLQESVLDVVETTLSVMDCLTKGDESSTKTDERKFLWESVLDVVETTSPVVVCLTEPDESSTKTDETDVSKCLQESVLDVVETTSSIMDCLTKPDGSFTKSDKTDVGKFLQESVLDVIETSSDLVESVSRHNETHETLNSPAVQKELLADTGSPSASADGDEPLKIAEIETAILMESKKYLQEDVLDIVDTTRNILDILTPDTSMSQSNSVLTDNLNLSSSVISAVDSSPLAADEVTTSLVNNIIEVVDMTSHLVSSVPENYPDMPIKTEDNSEVKIFVNEVLDVVEITSELKETVHKQNNLSASLDNPASSRSSIPESSTKEPIATLTPVSGVCLESTAHTTDKEGDQEGRGRRKRKRTLTYEIQSTNRLNKFDQVRFLSRPWRKPDGSLNRKALEKYLTAVLGHIMTNPGISQAQLIDRFETTMQPVFILELLEMLTECECVLTTYVKQSHNPGLFTEPVGYSLLNTWEPMSETLYEGSPDAILKMSYFLSGFLHYRR